MKQLLRLSELHLMLLVSLMVALLSVQACRSQERPQEKSHEAVHRATLTAKILSNISSDSLDLEIEKITKTEEEWREQLSANEYRILRNKGTEIPFTNEYWDNKDEGIYYCRACGLPLFSSDTKYKSGTGWPSFWAPISKRVVEERVDNSLFMTRTEIICARCESHIGHVFEDGPEPTELRYCMNSTALQFKKKEL